MTALLTNRSFQVFIIILASLGAVSALLAAGTLTNDNLLYTIIGFGLGVPVTAAAATPTAANIAAMATLADQLATLRPAAPSAIPVAPTPPAA